MKKFHKNSFLATNTHPLIGSWMDSASIQCDSNVEIVFSTLEPGFYAAPHIHTQTKTVVIVLNGQMTFLIDNEKVELHSGEYLIFEKGCVEEVVSVAPNTQNLTIHTPSIVGGDKKEVK